MCAARSFAGALWYNRRTTKNEESRMNRIYVFGHKNPYSDTICSAIVYAG